MQPSQVFRAWKWLLSHLVVAASIGYFSTMLVAGLCQVQPSTLLKATTFGLPHIGTMITSQGMALGVDAWITLFFCNLTVALSIVALVYWAQMLNPHNQNRSFLRFRRYLQKDRSAKYLLKIPAFARIQSPQLRVSSFLLLVVPYIATIALGLLTGAWIGVGHMFSSSLPVALAYILPHGIPEIAAILLACSLPVGTWMTIRPVVLGNESTSESFQSINHVLASQKFQQNLKMIINLLLIAGLTEAYLTRQVVAALGGS
jgi:uncharacterized membrane protein SpoIIM required for sporulation